MIGYSQMKEAWQVVRVALRHVGEDIFTTLVVNLLWLMLNGLVVTGPPATLALFYVANRLAHEEPTDVRDFLTALRRYFSVAWRWGTINLFVLFFLVGDVILMGQLAPQSLLPWMQGVYVTALLTWLLLQLYTLPFLFEQEQPQVKLALRNGAVMLGRNPGFSLALGLLLVWVVVLGTLFFLIIVAVGGLLIALIANHAVLNRLRVEKTNLPQVSQPPGG